MRNTEVVRRMINAYNTGKTDDVDEFIHPEYLNPGAQEVSTLRGPNAFALAVKWLKATFSDDAFLDEVSIEERGEWARAHLVLHGRHIGNLVGMAATGRRFAGEQIHLIRLRDAKIRDHRDWPDYIGTYRQLGAPWPDDNGWRP
ncbi:ester cyclase [Marinitenerispora sediminis]|uniref:SnoaL/DnrD family polyketide biosynthesis methyl ester cyclase n=1 Tax=Marinitenerispora sediminis TaxID=1931232 RepID=A0A368SYA8_9ACTN|nr:ester cyclase [Marinitenerispora sediminis]RCV47485.1 SnoaL/DnrD family polyketide biosynthesis methyl ester cyclase [Marinitenerispora sediminis]RCV47709.1 SnoaL/DnrD family polyketide biosynthesis methyl ester cyclase [Marinitenerispora sediminis]RCV48672.1 SnoaL/DnrD family polyketide biosynthesis methyl ester cyclase [Marinitenerispora sediminis]